MTLIEWDLFDDYIRFDQIAFLLAVLVAFDLKFLFLWQFNFYRAGLRCLMLYTF